MVLMKARNSKSSHVREKLTGFADDFRMTKYCQWDVPHLVRILTEMPCGTIAIFPVGVVFSWQHHRKW